MPRGDKKLYITFNEMGHGDNVLISLPNGKMVVIDCGTLRWDRNYWGQKPPVEALRQQAFLNALGDDKFLLNRKIIDLLVLTHPDKDHCCELGGLFTDRTVVSLDPTTKKPVQTVHKGATHAAAVFFSSNLSLFDKHGVPALLINQKKAASIFSLIINQQKSQIGQLGLVEDKDKKKKKLAVNFKDLEDSADGKAEIGKKSSVAATRGFVKILDGTAAGDADCGVYFLAGNVVPYRNIRDNSTQENRGSIVTMIVYGDKKFLFLGDATVQTEAFLLQTYGDLIKDLEVLHIPHHASLSTSLGADFVTRVNPRHAVITAAWDTGPQLALPRGEVIASYQAGNRLLNKAATATDAQKKVNCYKNTTVTMSLIDTKTMQPKRDRKGNPMVIVRNGNMQQQLDVPQQIWCTGTHGPIDFTYEKKADGSVDAAEN